MPQAKIVNPGAKGRLNYSYTLQPDYVYNLAEPGFNVIQRPEIMRDREYKT